MPFTDRSSPASPRSEHLLRQIGADLTPTRGAEERSAQKIRAHLRVPRLLADVRDVLAPPPGILERVWSHVIASIDPLRSSLLWERLRQALAPAEELRDLLWSRLGVRLTPAYARAFSSRPAKWVAAVAVVLIAVRASPLLFLAPSSIAGSSVTLFAGDGDAEVLLGSLWQPLTGEVTLLSPTRVQTQEAGATIVLHDDAVFRLGPGSRVALLDLSDRPETSDHETTLTLEQGTLWVLGLVPKHISGITVVTSQGRVVLHEGSVAIEERSGGEVLVRVFDRSATVLRHGSQRSLVAGERVVITGDADLTAAKMSSATFQELWVAENLTRDAAHQREIAQLQQERRAASAGILPSSRLYPVKRLAETVDVLFSLTPEERARKMISQANTRLNEAAALLTAGGTVEAESALREYRDTLIQVATGSGGSPIVQSLLQTEVVDAGPATVAAALPGDDAYVLKQAVDETIAALPADVEKPDVEGKVLLDQLSAVKRQAAQGDTELARETLSQLTDSLAFLETAGSLSLIPADVREEAKAAAEQAVAAVEGPLEGIDLTLGAPPKVLVVPQHTRIRPMTPEQVAAKVQEIRGRIFVYGTKKAQYDALTDQIGLLIRNPDRGRILRELATILPRNGLAQRVLREIRMVSEEVQLQVTASGGVMAR